MTAPKAVQPTANASTVQENYEVTYRSNKFGLQREQLSAVVKKVGPMVEDVAKELGKPEP